MKNVKGGGIVSFISIPALAVESHLRTLHTLQRALLMSSVNPAGLEAEADSSY